MLQFEYARSALKNGLKLEQELGVNPYKFGMIGSTDAHTGLAAVEEDNFFGKHSGAEPEPDRATHPFVKAPRRRCHHGLGADRLRLRRRVGDREHARGALRRHGAPRDLRHHRPAHDRALLRRLGLRGQRRAQPHAGARSATPRACRWAATCTAAPAGKAPTFLVAALKDPIGANLDRYQIVKGWLDAKGDVHEKVYDVAWSGDRKPGADGKLPAVGNTVDVANATWTNTIGAPELIAVWKDPDFDPAQRAFYYGRVIEIPTPRWTAYDAKRFGVKMPKEVPMTTPSAPTPHPSGTRRASRERRELPMKLLRDFFPSLVWRSRPSGGAYPPTPSTYLDGTPVVRPGTAIVHTAGCCCWRMAVRPTRDDTWMLPWLRAMTLVLVWASCAHAHVERVRRRDS